MTDQNRSDGDESGDETYEIDHIVSREAGAATLRRLADGIATGAVELIGDEAVTVTVPDQFELEIEYEESTDEAELEVELEWPLADEQPESVEPSEDLAAEAEADADTTEAADAEEPDTEAESDAAATEAVDSAVLDDEGGAEAVGVATPASKARFELFQDRASEWRWRLVHDNGNIIADSGEGYSRKATARKGLKSVMRNASGASVVEQVD